MKHVCIALAITTLAALPSFAQEEARSRDYGNRILQECAQMTDEQWETKLIKLNTVPMGDSLYDRALIGRASLLLQHERWDEALALADEGIRMGGDQEFLFHLDKGTALAGMEGHHEEGMAYLTSSMKRYPGSFVFPYIKALSAKEHKDYALALSLTQDLLRQYPMDPRGHALLAQIAEGEGRTAQAAMALSMALIISWGDRNDEGRLVDLNRILGGEIKEDPHGYDLGSGEDFTEIDLLIKNRVAMDKKYKVKPDLAYPMCRQSHLLFNYLVKEHTGTGFWSTYYVPLFKRIMQENLFEGFVYQCLTSSTSEEVSALAKKNNSLVEKFRARVQPMLMEMYQTFPDSAGAAPAQHFYTTQGGLQMVGTEHATQDLFEGPVTFYHPSGAISTQGHLGTDNRRTGPWIEHDANGHVSKKATYKNGNEEGVSITYFPDGTVQDSTIVIDGQLQGMYHDREVPGTVRQTKMYDKGKANGNVKDYYTCGTIENEYTMVNDLLDGAGTSYYADGVKQYAGTYAKGQRTSTHSTWYHNSKKQSEFTLVNGKAEGPYQRWHYNGAVSEDGNMKAGEVIGKIKYYAEDSVLKKESEYDASGRKTGLERIYNDDGTLYLENEFQNDLLVRYRYYDRQGKMVGEGQRKKGLFQLVGFSSEGNKAVNGTYLDEGLKDGAWVYYHEDGTVSSEENFNKGKLIGVQRDYDSNGRLDRQYDYRSNDRVGSYKQFYADGKPRYVGWLENGELNGTYRRYLPDGTLASDEYYVDGERQGWQRYFDADGKAWKSERIENGAVREKVRYDNTGKEYQRIVIPAGRYTMKETLQDGKPLSSVEMIDGVYHGACKYFFPNGRTAMEGRYVNGERDGLWTEYYPNGQKNTETQWELGNRAGMERSWFEDGLLWREEAYENGETHGLYRLYDRTGKLTIERIRKHGEEHGMSRAWTSEGALELFRWYDHDRLYAYASPKEDGTPKEQVALPQGVQDLKPTFPNGKPSREMHLRNGEIDGTYREFYPSGNVMEETPYVGGLMEGTSVEYHPNGKLYTSTEYKLGLRHGLYKRFDVNGKLVEEANFRYGDSHGEQKLYNASGKLIATYLHRSDVIIGIQ